MAAASQTPILAASPTALPAFEPPVALGAELYADSFDDIASWELQETDAGAASMLGGQLVLSARKRSISIVQPAPIEPLGDVYAEVQVRPTVCSPGDEFGLMIRLAPSGGHYRASLLCEGALRLLRVLPDQTNALTEVKTSGAIIPGTTGTNLLAVVVQGPLLQVFVNRQLVLEDRDARLPVGGLGFFARAGRGGQATVAFDDLAVYSLAPTPAPPR
jgi:hypothetical protein